LTTFATSLERGRSRVTIKAGELSAAAIDEVEALFEEAYGDHPAIITVDLSAAESIDRAALDMFVRWHDTADRTGFHVLFVNAGDGVYRRLRAAGLDCMPNVQRH
jgi:anti-anti-sigma regulatory factor